MSEVNVDKITIDIILHNLEAICVHMADVLIKTSYSPLFSDQNDFSTALFTKDGKLIAMNLGCPVHIAAMPFSVKAALDEFQGDIKPGDTIFLNDPYRGGTHISDYTFISPVFVEKEIVAFVATRAHVTDPGSADPFATIKAESIIQEGIRVPPVKLYEEGKPTDIAKVLITMTRLPTFMEGDIKAAVEGSNTYGLRMLQTLYKKYSKQVMEIVVEELLDYAERRIRKSIKEIPEGIYKAEDFIDSDYIKPDPIPIKVAITVQGDEMIVDWTGTSGPVKTPLNRPKHAAIGDTLYTLKCILDPHGTLNDGMFRPIKVNIPENSLLDAKWPRPVHEGNLITTSRMADVILKALAPAVPYKVMGSMYGGCMTIALSGIDPKTGFPFILIDMPPGGWGGRASKDGNSANWILLGNCRDLPIEVIEALYPVRVTSRQLITDSGGPGKYRGGLGVEEGFIGLCTFNVMMRNARIRDGPPGVFSGRPGKPLIEKITYPNGKEEIYAGWRKDGVLEIGGKMLYDLSPGTIVFMEEAGGGGYGNPLEKEPNEVLEDVLDGYVSIKAAEKDYGVVIDPKTLEIEDAATKKIREKISTS